MFINNINPVLLNLGPFEVRYYGLIYALGFLIGYLFLRRRIKQKRLKLSYDALDSFFFWLVIGVVVGARLFEIIFFSWPYYSTHIVEMLMIWNGGLSFHGGLVGAALVVYLFSKKHKLHFYDIADSLVIPTAIALAFGRIANFINSEHYGMITNAVKTPWCVVYQKVDSFCRHPSQLYESLTNFVTFGALMFYDNYSQKKGKYKKGTLFWSFIIMYGILRFLVNFYREDPSYQFFLGISVGQWLSLIMILIGAVFLVRINLLAPKKSL